MLPQQRETWRSIKKIKIQLNLSTFSVVSRVGFMSLFNNTFSISWWLMEKIVSILFTKAFSVSLKSFHWFSWHSSANFSSAVKVMFSYVIVLQDKCLVRRSYLCAYLLSSAFLQLFPIWQITGTGWTEDAWEHKHMCDWKPSGIGGVVIENKEESNGSQSIKTEKH